MLCESSIDIREDDRPKSVREKRSVNHKKH